MNSLKERLPTQMGRRSTRGHVRRSKKSLPWWLVVVAGIIGVIAIWGLVQIVFPDGVDTHHSPYHNRTWLNADNWTATEPNRTQVEALVDRLHENRIDRIYVQAGDWRVNGSYLEHNFAPEFRAMMHDIDPDIEVLVWVWVKRDLYTNSESRIALVSFTEKALRDWDYDGIHLQEFEVVDESETFVQLVRSLDTVADNYNGILSITVPPDRRPADPDVPVALGDPTVSWSPRYKQQLALIVDEMVIMAHTSGIKTEKEYREWFAYQVKVYAEDVSRINEAVNVIIALPTFPEDDLHNPNIENLENGIKAAKDGIKQADSARSMIHGAGVYRYNTTTTQDWVFFHDEWVEN